MEDPENDESADPPLAYDQRIEEVNDSPQNRTSVLERGDPKYSQTRETVENNTPISEILQKEQEKVYRRFQRATKHLEKAQAHGVQEQIDAAEAT